jgi:hypothetical protein
MKLEEAVSDGARDHHATDSRMVPYDRHMVDLFDDDAKMMMPR